MNGHDKMRPLYDVAVVAKAGMVYQLGWVAPRGWVILGQWEQGELPDGTVMAFGPRRIQEAPLAAAHLVEEVERVMQMPDDVVGCPRSQTALVMAAAHILNCPPQSFGHMPLEAIQLIVDSHYAMEDMKGDDGTGRRRSGRASQ